MRSGIGDYEGDSVNNERHNHENEDTSSTLATPTSNSDIVKTICENDKPINNGSLSLSTPTTDTIVYGDGTLVNNANDQETTVTTLGNTHKNQCLVESYPVDANNINGI